MNTAIKLLFIQDPKENPDWVIHTLSQAGYSLKYQIVETEDEVAAALQNETWDLVIINDSHSDTDSTTGLSIVEKNRRLAPSILVSSRFDEDALAEAITLGAQAFVIQGKSDWLLTTVRRQLQASSLRKEHQSVLDESQRIRKHYHAIMAGQTVSSKHSLQDVIEAVLEHLAQVLPYDSACVYLIEKNRARIQAGRGYERFTDEENLTSITFPLDSTFIKEIVGKGKILMIPDVRKYPGWITIPFSEHIRSYLGVPLRARDQVIGFFSLDRITPGSFSPSELEIAEIFAVQTSAAIENAYLLDAEEKRGSALEILRQVSLQVTATLEPEGVLDAILEGVFKLIPDVQDAHIFTYDGEQLSFGSSLWHDGRRGEILSEPRQNGLTYNTARSGEMILVDDLKTHPLFAKKAAEESWGGSIVGIPVKIGERVVGVLNVAHHNTHGFTESELKMLRLMSDQVGLALSNARRYQDINRLVDLLASEQNRLESLLEMLPTGVLLLDKDHKLLLSNPLGKEYLSHLSPSFEKDRVTSLGEIPVTDILGAQDTTLPIEISAEKPQRDIYEVQASQIKGDDVQWVLTLRNVTHERETQEQIQMQERLATVGQLAAGIAHDFNNIMAAIVVYADLLMMDPNLTTASQEKLTIIQQQIQRASSLIRQILDFSRRSVMEQSTLHLIPFMKEMRKLLERTLPETIQIHLKYQKAEFAVTADPIRLQQVFMNLAVNARDAMPKGGRLSFYLEHHHIKPGNILPITEMETGNWVRISVSDTGVGIPSQNQSRIFEPFFTTKSVGQGTGLGLAQVYGIVRQHEGFINVKSQVGQGTQFDIYLPALTAAPEPIPERDAQQFINGSGKTVLLVEDDSSTRSALRAMLEAQHFRVVLASNGSYAVQILEAQGDEINLVVSDIVMPEMGGMDLLTILQIRWPKKRILFITGHPMDSQPQNPLALGKVEWLQKPFSISDFNKAIQNLLESKL